MAKKNVKAKDSRSSEELKNRIVKIFIILMFVLSPVWLISGAVLIIGSVRPPVSISEDSVSFYSFVYIETDEIYSPVAFDSQYGRINSCYCVAEYENKYVIVHFSSEEWEKLKFEEIPDEQAHGQMYRFPASEKLSGAQGDISSELKSIVIDFYNEHIGTGLDENNFSSVFSSKVIEINDKSQIKDGFTSLIFISLALLLGYLYLSKNKKKETQGDAVQDKG